MTAPRRRCDAHIALQLVIDNITRRWRATQPRHDDIDLRDPLIDLEHCPTCGADLHDRETTDAGAR